MKQINMRAYLLTPKELKRFDPLRFTENLKRAGFKFDSDVCPIQIKKPWHRAEIVETGAIAYYQWDEE